MEGKFDWLKDDPCYGCKHAKRLEDKDIGMFDRRLGCTNIDRRNRMVQSAANLLRTNDVEAVMLASGTLNEVVEMDQQYARKGYFDCVPGIVPNCFEKEEENG